MLIWSTREGKTIARTNIKGVKALEYAFESDLLYALTDAQLHMLQGNNLEVASLFVSLEQELIEYTYANDVLDLANLETENLFDLMSLPGN